MDVEDIVERLRGGLAGLELVEHDGDWFFYYRPEGGEPDHRLPFATIVARDDAHEGGVSRLYRPGVFRFNVAAGREAYQALFGPPPTPLPDWPVRDTGHDYSTLGGGRGFLPSCGRQASMTRSSSSRG